MKRIWSIVGLLLLLPSVALALDGTSIPPKFAIPWANSAGSAYSRSIPQSSLIGVQNCAASLTDGFPPLTFVPAGGGGCPPFGQDFNGILKQLSQWSLWQAAAGPIIYDSGFAASIGGYAKGTILSATATVGNYWISTVDNNTTNPDAAGAGWTGFTSLVLNNGVSAGTYLRPKTTVDSTGRVTTIVSGAPPTYVRLTSGSGTYSPTAGTVRIKVRMIAAGGGGAGSGASGTNGSNGAASNLGSWTVNPGQLGTANSGTAAGVGGAGGTGGSNGTGTLIYRGPGSRGGDGLNQNGGLNVDLYGGIGGIGPFGGVGQSGFAAPTQTAPGAGGAGAGQSGTNQGSGGAGGSGEYVEFQVTSPGSLAYSVGTGGTAGTGSGTGQGANGATGLILIEEDYD